MLYQGEYILEEGAGDFFLIVEGKNYLSWNSIVDVEGGKDSKCGFGGGMENSL